MRLGLGVGVDGTASTGEHLDIVEAIRQRNPQRARELIEEGARRALADLSAGQPYDPGRPAEIEIDFSSPDRLRE